MQIRLFILFLAFTGSLLAGCSQGNASEAQGSATPETFVEIIPYITHTPAVSTTPTAQPLPTQTPPPLPTATPYLYTVVANDTMIGIASYFGITLDELMVANPEANPNTLSIGTQLIIPLKFDETDENQPSASADVLAMQSAIPACYPVRSGGLWCYWLISNQYDQPVENISGIINLYDSQNELAASKTAAALLNVLAPGKSAPLIAYFPPPVPAWAQAQGQITSAIYANQYQTRYLAATLDQPVITPIDTIGGENQAMMIQGILRYPAAGTENPLPPDYAWVVAVAYDAGGTVVGVRRWEAAEVPINGELNFNLEIYSLGKPIETVDILTEVPAAAP